MQAHGTNGILPKLLGVIEVGKVLPPATVDLLTAYQPQARFEKLLLDESEGGDISIGDCRNRRRKKSRRSGRRRRGGEVGADSKRLANEEPGVLRRRRC